MGYFMGMEWDITGFQGLQGFPADIWGKNRNITEYSWDTVG